jgi:hypothetical protein
MNEQIKDRWELKVQPDGTVGECYFCAAPVKRGEDFAVMVVERVEPKGDPIHAVCHGQCVDEASRV